MEDFLNKYKKVTNQFIDNHKINKPLELYEPIFYFLKNGGKRIRPIMTLMSYNIFKNDFESIIKPAMAVEYFHNFSLIHDDIMDNAELRRNHPTIHKKYDLNTAILSGDALLIIAYKLFNNIEGEKYKKSIQLFSKTALEVCEGQQLDMNFEKIENVYLDDYFLMIKYKTAVLGAYAFQLGAILANASINEQQLLYDFGIHLGMAFQLRDDYLDVFGNSQNTGKKLAGDIIENKKTILYVLAFDLIKDKNELIEAYKIEDEDEKIKNVKNIFINYNIDKLALKLINEQTNNAYKILNKLKFNTQELRELTCLLLNRNE